jgi:hypothetical protein
VLNGGAIDPTSATGSEQIDWFGTVRARFGYTATSNLLSMAPPDWPMAV